MLVIRHICRNPGQTFLIPSRSAFVKRKTKDSEVDSTETETQTRKRNTKYDGPAAVDRFTSLEKESLPSKKAYSPPSDVEDRIESITKEICGDNAEWRAMSLADRRVKFKILTRCIKEFEHDIPNAELNDMNTNTDLIRYFSTPVQDRNSFADLSKLDLPRNLHIQQDPLRFDPDNDPMFGGVSAFPGRSTIISSLRAKKKYKGTTRPQYWPDQYLDD